jgi:5'-nucleotidase/UDP-sugar diphosphatase
MNAHGVPSLRSLALAVLAAGLVLPARAHDYAITILHNNDGESRLTSYTDALAGYGGIARFKTMLDQTRTFYSTLGHGVVAIYAGDTFLPGAQFQASLDSGAAGSRTFYDALAISRIGYDASVIGNHEFDFGPDVLAEFIGDAQTTNPTTYLSANLGFSGEAALQAHVTAGRVAPSKLVNVSTGAGTKKVGIIGATTETLAFVSSPGAVTIGSVATAVNSQIASLKSAGADHIILGTHLQGLASDNTLVASLDPGVDLIVAGGGDEILRTSGAPAPSSVYAGAPASVAVTGLIPGDNPATLSGGLTGVTNTYPLVSTGVDKGGRSVPIVTTGGNYGYLGRVTLAVTGTSISIDVSSGPQRVADLSVDATHGVSVDATVQAESVAPVVSYVAGLAADKRAETSVQLLHGGSPTIRSRQTNLGALVADALLHTAQERASLFGVGAPQIALVNGGGIRANVTAGNVTTKSTFDVSPFGNFVSVVEDLRLHDLKLLLENAYSKTTENIATPGIDAVGSDGRFAHLGGMSVVYDITRPGMMLSGGAVATPGTRIRSITIGGTPYLENGSWLVDPLATTFNLAVPDFLARGGDQYFRYAIGGSTTYLSQLYSFTTLGITDQQALRGYVDFMANGDLTFDISSYTTDYGVQQSFQGTRISAVPEPATWTLLVAGVAGAALLEVRRARRRMATRA